MSRLFAIMICSLLLAPLAVADNPPPGVIVVQNDQTSGTTSGKAAKLTTANPGTAITAGTSDTAGFIGICVDNCTSSGTAWIAQTGLWPVIVDGTTTAGHYLVISTTVAGDLHDTTSATPPTSGVVFGRVIIPSTGAGSATYALLLGADLVSPGLTGGGSVTVNNVTCTVGGGSCAPYGGVNVYTAAHTVGTTDIGKLIIMNCSSACAVTFEAAPAATDWWGVETIGGTNATITLNGPNWNGGATAPTLNKFRDLRVGSDGTNYFGDAPLAAGSNITLTPTATAFTIASSGGAPANYFTSGTLTGIGDASFTPTHVFDVEGADASNAILAQIHGTTSTHNFNFIANDSAGGTRLQSDVDFAVSRASGASLTMSTSYFQLTTDNGFRAFTLHRGGGYNANCTNPPTVLSGFNSGGSTAPSVDGNSCNGVGQVTVGNGTAVSSGVIQVQNYSSWGGGTNVVNCFGKDLQDNTVNVLVTGTGGNLTFSVPTTFVSGHVITWACFGGNNS